MLIIYLIGSFGYSPIIVQSASDSNLNLSEIWIRDPNILLWNGVYYMTGTTAEEGFLGYFSTDLETWHLHGHIYQRNASNYWAQRLFWAPEMVEYEGKFYLFFTGYNDTYKRGTGVAVADHPMGPYVDLMPEPLTPPEFDCLDGHLFQHPNGSLYFYYVFEWLNNGTGEMWVQKISSDFTKLLGDPISLFKGGDSEWSNNVIDGPSMIYQNNKYYLFWSSFNSGNTFDHKSRGYCLGFAESDSPLGPFSHSKDPIIWSDGGHSTWFKDKNNILKIVYHQPNSNTEHAIIKNLLFDSNTRIWSVDPREPFVLDDEIVITLIIFSSGMIIGSTIYVIKRLKKKVN